MVRFPVVYSEKGRRLPKPDVLAEFPAVLGYYEYDGCVEYPLRYEEEQEDEAHREVLEDLVYIAHEFPQRLFPRILEPFPINEFVLVHIHMEAGVIEPVELVGLRARETVELLVDVDSFLRESFDDADFAINDFGKRVGILRLRGEARYLIVCGERACECLVDRGALLLKHFRLAREIVYLRLNSVDIFGEVFRVEPLDDCKHVLDALALHLEGEIAAALVGIGILEDDIRTRFERLDTRARIVEVARLNVGAVLRDLELFGIVACRPLRRNRIRHGVTGRELRHHCAFTHGVSRLTSVSVVIVIGRHCHVIGNAAAVSGSDHSYRAPYLPRERTER